MYNININIQQGTIMRKWQNCIVKYFCNFYYFTCIIKQTLNPPPTRGGVDKLTLVRLN